MLREQGARINSDGVNAISAGLTQRMKHADAAVQSSAAILLIPCGGPRRLNRSSWIIQKGIFRMSDRLSYTYRAKLYYKHQNNNQRKGVHRAGKYAINQHHCFLRWGRGVHSPLAGLCFLAAYVNQHHAGAENAVWTRRRK